jgi:hypothetical protein
MQSGFMGRAVKSVVITNFWRRTVAPRLEVSIDLLGLWFQLVREISRFCFLFFLGLYVLGGTLLAFRSTPEITMNWFNTPGQLVVALLRWIGVF